MRNVSEVNSAPKPKPKLEPGDSYKGEQRNGAVKKTAGEQTCAVGGQEVHLRTSERRFGSLHFPTVSTPPRGRTGGRGQWGKRKPGKKTGGGDQDRRAEPDEEYMARGRRCCPGRGKAGRPRTAAATSSPGARAGFRCVTQHPSWPGAWRCSPVRSAPPADP